MLGVPGAANDKELNEKLVKAVKSSRAKGYHGQEHDANMPEPLDQSETRIKAMLSDIADLKIEMEDLKKDINDPSDSDTETKQKQHVKAINLKASLKTANDDVWKQLCAKHFSYIEQAFHSKKDLKITSA